MDAPELDVAVDYLKTFVDLNARVNKTNEADAGTFAYGRLHSTSPAHSDEAFPLPLSAPDEFDVGIAEIVGDDCILRSIPHFRESTEFSPPGHRD